MSRSSENFSSRVAEHYNQVEQKPKNERQESDIIGLRNFNNAIKSLMHNKAIRLYSLGTTKDGEPLRALDLGCGKGGDLLKYIKNERIGLVVGIDIADVSIDQCRERYRKISPNRKFRGEFLVADLTRENIRRKLIDLGIEQKFNIASCQFSLHYSFETFEQAVRYISNAAENLERLGIFVGTYPDGPKLLKLVRNSDTPGTYVVHDVLRVEFPQESYKDPKPFGTKYHFHLKEVVNCPEFLVHPLVLEELMKKLGFFKIFDRSFEELVRLDAKERTFKDIFKIHKAFEFESDHAILDKTTWQVASVYRCFCYRKA